MIDTTIVRAHQQAATGKGGAKTRLWGVPFGAFPLGRSRGGLSSKIHMLADAMGRPLRFVLSAGEVNDAAPKRIVYLRTSRPET
jgi:hypothetical protein